MLWYIVHTIYALTQIALLGASFASFTQEGFKSVHGFPGKYEHNVGNVIRPWVSFIVVRHCKPWLFALLPNLFPSVIYRSDHNLY